MSPDPDSAEAASAEPQPSGRKRAPAPFVVGVARSGTTLLRLMLDAHPELAIPPETHFLPRLVRLSEELAEQGASDRQRRREIRDFLSSHPRWDDFGIPMRELDAQLKDQPRLSPRRVARAFYASYAARHGKARWGDKTPAYLGKMVQIHETLPEARFVHMIRDGRDVALSLSDVEWGTDDLRSAAEWWKDEIRTAKRRARGNMQRRHYKELRYEDLVAEPQARLREVAEFISLPWDDAMLSYHLTAEERMREVARELRGEGGATISAEARARQHSLVAEPPQSTRVGRWRTEMSDADRELFESIAGRLLQRLGYEVENPGGGSDDNDDDDDKDEDDGPGRSRGQPGAGAG